MVYQKKCVIEAAIALIEQSDTVDFSMRALADSLNIKTTSLYNHIPSMETLMIEICIYALQMQREKEMDSIKNKTGNEAIMSLANAYHTFAKEHKELYRLIMNTAVSCSELNEIQQCIVEPFLKVLEHTSFSETEKIHWQRVLRGIVHGLVSQENAGFFSHLPASVDDSFKTAIQCYIDGLKQAKGGK